MVAIVFWHVEVYRAVAFISVSGVEDFLDVQNLLYNVSRGVRLDAWRKHIERFHRFVVAVKVELYHFHWLELFEASFLCNLVFAVVGIVFQMPHIGDVAHISHFVAQVLQISEENVECYSRAGVSQMGVAIHCWAAHIHAHAPFVQRLEAFFGAGERVIYQ